MLTLAVTVRGVSRSRQQCGLIVTAIPGTDLGVTVGMNKSEMALKYVIFRANIYVT